MCVYSIYNQNKRLHMYGVAHVFLLVYAHPRTNSHANVHMLGTRTRTCVPIKKKMYFPLTLHWWRSRLSSLRYHVTNISIAPKINQFSNRNLLAINWSFIAFPIINKISITCFIWSRSVLFPLFLKKVLIFLRLLLWHIRTLILRTFCKPIKKLT